ncbi:hypothetical protein [Paenirhodobacter enshiensis]|uniref:hypothetical protein n=1 Tax=Paenirhodobacter enshiensis TaxID=1105367 RepID=UPI001FE011F1|nr:hypothetical protein [Paenirhodobacter enshiensis]
MADYFTHFSCLLDVGTPERAARALDLYNALSDENAAGDPPSDGFLLSIQPEHGGTRLWMRDDGTGDPEHVIQFVKRCAKEFGLTGLWGMQYTLCRIRHKAYYAGIGIMPHGQCPGLRTLALAMRSFGIFRATRGRPAADRLVGIGWI